MKRGLYWLPALVFTLIGVVYLYASLAMPEAWSGGYGHRLVPLTMSVLVVTLAGGLLLSQFFSSGSAVVPAVDPTEVSTRVSTEVSTRGTDELIRAADFLYRALPVILMMLAYALLQTWLGYLVASVICSVAVFKLFGNSWPMSLLHSAIGISAIYLLFFKLLNLYDPPGRFFDLSLLLQ